VKDCNLIVATCQNNAAINMSIQKAAKDLIKGGKYDQGILDRIEMVIRPYDPCLSCATHDMSGRMPIRLDIVDADGKLVDTLVNH